MWTSKRLTAKHVAAGLVALLLFCLTLPVAHPEQPPVIKKFIVYGGPAKTLDAELRGRVVARYPGTSMIYVVPDRNYEHLLLEGNRRHPTAQDDRKAWELYRDNILPETGPIIKVEAEPIPGIQKGVDQLPEVIENGTPRPFRKGDHVRITGLYVVDYAHSMYSDLHTRSVTYMRGAYKAAYVHAEIHPYNHTWELLPSTPASSEVHLVGAPICPEVYSWTYWWNKKWGKAGHFVNDAIQTQTTAEFFIPAPPRPGPNFEPRLVMSEVTEQGDGTSTVTSTPTDTGVSVRVVEPDRRLLTLASIGPGTR